jgi:hypothetical protein
MTHQVKIAPPVRATSVKFMASSMEIIETKDIPIAVLKANLNDICLESMKVSRPMDVKIPLIIAKDIINTTGQSISIN